MLTWTKHEAFTPDGTPNPVVAPDERLSWPRTISIGAQHIVAMFGATFLVPLLTGFSPSTTLLFSGIGTLLFLVITGNRLPSYVGSSFAFISPVLAAKASNGPGGALGGIVMIGVLMVLIGLLTHKIGTGWIDALMPPVVMGSIVALIGFNLAPTAMQNFEKSPVTAIVTVSSVVLCTVLFRGLLGRLSIFVGVVIGYAVAVLRGEVDFTTVHQAPWVGLPEFHTPSFDLHLLPMFLPVIVVLIAENVGHVKSVSQMTGRDLSPLVGRALIADGVATGLAGTFGGSAATTYGENIGVMAATKVYSTAAYWVAGIGAVLLGLLPKVGAVINTIPLGVLGGVTLALYGMIGIIGVRIMVENRVDFANPANSMCAAIALVIGVANYSVSFGKVEFGGIALGTLAAIVVFHVMNSIGRARGTLVE